MDRPKSRTQSLADRFFVSVSDSVFFDFFSSIGWSRPDTKDLDNMRRAISAFFTPLSFKMKQLLEPPLIPSSTHGTIIFFSLASKKLIYGLFFEKKPIFEFFQLKEDFFC